MSLPEHPSSENTISGSNVPENTVPDGLLVPTYLGGPEITGENCAREPIHIPGSIQPHGALLVVQADSEGSPVLQVSENLGNFLNVQATAALGQGLEHLLGEAVTRSIQDALPLGTVDRLQYRTVVPGLRGQLSLTAHRVGPRLVLEVEPLPGAVQDGHRLRNAIFALEAASSLQELLEVAVQAAGDLSGFDRVMIYRFAADGSGEVLAERRRADLPSFLGHRFPESDIPAQARALYTRHLLRLTADVTAPAVPLVPRLDPLTLAPTPLGGAVLRATSPMHVQYLKNMGVASSLSVSIVVGGVLWGLISCHHCTPHVTPPGVRSALEELGRLLNLQVQLKEQADVAAFRASLHAGQQRVLNVTANSLTPLSALADPALGLRELLGADGLALHLEGQWLTLGDVPDTPALVNLLDWLRVSQLETLFATEHLPGAWPAAHDWVGVASGLLAVSIGRGWQEAALWFRGEAKLVEVWGGATPEHAKTELGPRQSFATYVQDLRAHAQPWHPGEVEEARALAQNLTATLGERLATLRHLNKELTRSNEEWRKFAFVISHDMQEPVRLIRQFIELFKLRQAASLDDQTRTLLEYLKGETVRLSSLTHDLYAYTELLSYPQLKLSEIEVGELLGRSLQPLTELSARKKLKWEGPPKKVFIVGDDTKLQLALTHLLRNALTFSPAPVHVQVTAQQDEANGHFTLSISDDGPGIPEAFHERVFELFQRLSPPSNQQGAATEPGAAPRGNGVGLTLARKVAELHGGSLTLSSAAGRGTTVTLRLPKMLPRPYHEPSRHDPT